MCNGTISAKSFISRIICAHCWLSYGCTRTLVLACYLSRVFVQRCEGPSRLYPLTSLLYFSSLDAHPTPARLCNHSSFRRLRALKSANLTTRCYSQGPYFEQISSTVLPYHRLLFSRVILRARVFYSCVVPFTEGNALMKQVMLCLTVTVTNEQPRITATSSVKWF